MVLGMEDPPEDCYQQFKKKTGRDDDTLLIFLEKLATAGFPEMNLAVIIRGAQVLAVSGDGCCSLQGSSGRHFECHFLTPVQIPQPDGTDPSPRSHGLSSFHHWPLGFPGQILDADLHETLPWALGLLLDFCSSLLWDPSPWLDSSGL
ncbi:hypothetical protein H920_19151 [Fukomys damarensis]|uniref:Uncharacterized protein n=1 Tax=Fukomys damarensis TaxID=885580 RepID=A0A091CQ78_FUKDA|nr:hypothetical protein H920_19151 [Fukomys damarensis]